MSNLLKKQKLLEADVAAHEDRAKELSKEAGFLIEKSSGSDALDPDVVRQKQSAIEERCASRISDNQQGFHPDSLQVCYDQGLDEEEEIKAPAIPCYPSAPL